MAITTVIKRPPTFKAVQFTGTNEAEVAQVVRADQFTPSTDYEPAMIHLPFVGSPIAYPRALYPGVWVVANNTEALLLTQGQYDAQYAPATP